MADGNREVWQAETKRYEITCACERGLQAASGIAWQHLGMLAAGIIGDYGRDSYDPARSIIAEYLRQTGRAAEASEVQAIGCNEPPPVTGFGSIPAEKLAALKNALKS